MNKGNLFVISGPSGVGKNTVEKELYPLHANLQRVVTCTTRSIRPGEKDGKDYHFLTEEQFKQMIEGGDFLEWAEVHTRYYGTPQKGVDELLAAGKDVLLIIDVQGGVEVKAKRPDTILIFLTPEKMEYLEKHLDERGDVSEEQRKIRRETTKREMGYCDQYDYVVTSYEENVIKTAQEIVKIMKNA